MGIVDYGLNVVSLNEYRRLCSKYKEKYTPSDIKKIIAKLKFLESSGRKIYDIQILNDKIFLRKIYSSIDGKVAIPDWVFGFASLFNNTIWPEDMTEVVFCRPAVYVHCEDDDIDYTERDEFTIQSHEFFRNIKSESLVIRNLDASFLDLNKLFTRCSSLKTVVFENFITIRNCEAKAMLSHAYSLEYIDFGDLFTLAHCYSVKDMFWGCAKLRHVRFGKSFVINEQCDITDMFRYCNAVETIEMPKDEDEKSLIKRIKRMGDLSSKFKIKYI